MDFFMKKIIIISLALNPMTFLREKIPEALLKSIFGKTDKVESSIKVELRLKM